MTNLRWDNVPKRRVERPPLLVPSSKSARRKWKPPNLNEGIEEVGGARTGLQDLARSARAAARATSGRVRSDRCSACKARGVTLWQVAGRLVCAHCRTASRTACAPQSGHRQGPGHQKAVRKERTVSAATAEKDIAWASRQGENDRKAGTGCRKYKVFLRIHNLPRSQSTLRMWNAYLSTSQPAKAAPLNTSPPKPKQKSLAIRGLALSDTTTPRRKTVRRYDRVEPRKSELSPEIAALLMKLNQQNTLVDMWR
jgi:hypothetical protein